MEQSGIPVEAERALEILRRVFTDSLLGVYLHGSAVAGGLRPDSDVDVLAIIGRSATPDERDRLLGALMTVSGRPGKDAGMRPLEMLVFRRADLFPVSYPARSEFLYGEWRREAYEAVEVPAPETDPEFTLILAQARQKARSLLGPDVGETLPVIPEADIRRAIGDALPALLATLEGDERNVLLTLARMWRTLETGTFVPKDIAAEWAEARLPAEAATVMADARAAYLGLAGDDWRKRRQVVLHVAEELRRRVKDLL
ncbi:aminoglycoside adenylyltransferase family protein [Rhizobiaceae bacterium BDR2-2]|uniref:Aminoglycoside (3'') (9) adenylyltransferase n=1 Tax=Ectorhizobium quercum TaxID=2965071 RepID=A0AAE3N1G3_9HYPH|nr:aminoglycoside adenylyltransferase family protein [Ectorhizobium quercum]MCX8999028.1 aminoglycoside adenylyltransferase family protein [Ectorhizobium quercum]